MRYSVTVDEQAFSVEVEQGAQPQWQVSLNGQPIAIDWAQIGPGHFSLLVGERSFEVFLRSVPGEGGSDTKSFEVLLDGQPQAVTVVDERRHALAGLAGGHGASGEAQVKAPMPGMVAQVLVAPGDVVERGQRVVVLEAMKMQNDLLAPRGGIVRAVKTQQGQAVNQGQPLVIIGDAEAQDQPAPTDDAG
jgi:biotin carboxyl carrier protein